MSNFRQRLFMGRKEVKLYTGDLNLILTILRDCQILDSSRKMFKVNAEGYVWNYKIYTFNIEN